jgi:hypothetical protein
LKDKLANGMKIWKGNGNITVLLLFSLIGFEMLHQGRREQVKSIVMELFNSILLKKSPDLLRSSILITHQSL